MGVIEFISSVLILLSEIMILLTIIIFLPLSIFKRTRKVTGLVILFSSYLYGITIWLISAIITFSYWGTIGLVFGLVILGIGVFPMAFFAIFREGIWDLLIMLVIGAALVFTVRLVGSFIIERS